MANYQSGGSFLPSGDMLLGGTVTIAASGTLNVQSGAVVNWSGAGITGATLTGATLTGTTTIGSGATLTTSTLTGTTTIGTGATLTGPSIIAPAITGAGTIASGATITTPTMLVTTVAVTATGTTGGNGAVLTTVTPQCVVISAGATGSGVDIPTGAGVVGAQYEFFNTVAASIRIYATGTTTINGTTGATAFILTNTGNNYVKFVCTAAGTWFAKGNT